MKKKIILILFLVLSVITAKVASAKIIFPDSAFGTTVSVGYKFNTPTVKMSDGEYYSTYYQTKYYFNDDGKQLKAYCHNPGYDTGFNGIGTHYEATQLVVNCETEACAAYEYGVVAMLKQSATKDSAHSNYNYLAITNAIRIFEKFWEHDSNKNNSTDWNNIIDVLTIRLLEDEAFEASVNNYVTSITGYKLYTPPELNDNLEKGGLTAYDKDISELNINFCYAYKTDTSSGVNCSNGNYTNKVYDLIKEYIKTGLSAAKKYYQGGVASVDVSKKSEVRSDGSVEIPIEIKVNNFKNDDQNVKKPYFNVSLNCENCGNNVTAEIYKGKNKISNSKNLLDYVTNGSGTIKLTLKFVAKDGAIFCDNIKYSLNSTYYDGSIDAKAYKIKKIDKENKTKDYQELYALVETGVPLTDELTHSFNLCNGDCLDIQRMCKEDRNDAACSIFNNAPYYGKCVRCGTQISKVDCTSNSNEFVIKEGMAYNDYEYVNDNESCDFKSTEDIKQCILNGEDQSGNTYEAYSNNSCSVYCKEDYTITLPGQLDAGVANKFTLRTTVKGTKTCYTKEITSTAKSSEVKQCKNEMEKLMYNNTNYNPSINFWYEENYIREMKSRKLVEETKKYNKGNIKTCSGEVDDAYNCASWGNDLNSAKYMKMTSTVEATYIPAAYSYTITPHGGILSYAGKEEVQNGTNLGNYFPVQLNKKSGVYNYTLTVSNLGQYYNSKDIKLGRLWGDAKSVLNSTLNAKECKYTGSILNKKDDKINKLDNVDKLNEISKGSYLCSYKINCPDCPVTCDPPCHTCPTCPLTCDNCDIGNNKLEYRPITPGDLNPNDRELGKNWASDETIGTDLELKAHVTKEEIAENGEEIYDVTYSDEGDFAMKVTMDSKMIRKIREYNKDQENNGGYSNNSLKCYDYKDVNGNTYENIFCYSSFIDMLIKEMPNNIKISGGTRPLKDEDRKNKSTGYFTTWSMAVQNNNWQVNTDIGFAIGIKKYGTDIQIGPSWK